MFYGIRLLQVLFGGLGVGREYSKERRKRSLSLKD